MKVACEGEVFVNGVARQCGERATIHYHVTTRDPKGGSPNRVEMHRCVRCADEHARRSKAAGEAWARLNAPANGAGEVAVVDVVAPTTPADTARLVHAALYGSEPVAHPYAPPDATTSPPDAHRCTTCGHHETDRYHTHVIERARALRELELEDVREVVADPRAAAPRRPDETAPTPVVPAMHPEAFRRAFEDEHRRALDALLRACVKAAVEDGAQLPAAVHAAMVHANDVAGRMPAAWTGGGR